MGGQELGARLVPDDLLVARHDAGEGMGPEGAAQHVVGLGIGDPGTQGLVDGVLEGALTVLDDAHPGAQETHALDIGRLACGVQGTHVDHALQAQESRGRGAGHPVLSGSGLRQDALLAHAARQQTLPQGVVELVRTGVQQVLALEPQVHAPGLGESTRVIGGRGSTGVGLEQAREFGVERLVLPRRDPGGLQREEVVHQGLGSEHPAEGVRARCEPGGPLEPLVAHGVPSVVSA